MKKKSVGVAYLLWLISFIGICGINRFYARKYVSGVIWLLTLGLGGIGIIIDLFLIPSHIRMCNLENGLNQQIVVNVVNNNNNTNNNA